MPSHRLHWSMGSRFYFLLPSAGNQIRYLLQTSDHPLPTSWSGSLPPVIPALHSPMDVRLFLLSDYSQASIIWRCQKAPYPLHKLRSVLSQQHPSAGTDAHIRSHRYHMLPFLYCGSHICAEYCPPEVVRPTGIPRMRSNAPLSQLHPGNPFFWSLHTTTACQTWDTGCFHCRSAGLLHKYCHVHHH